MDHLSFLQQHQGGRMSYSSDHHRSFGSNGSNNNHRNRYLWSPAQQTGRQPLVNQWQGDDPNVDDDFDPFFNEDFLEENVDISSSAPAQSLWFHGKLDRFAAEKRLQSTGRLGSYLVRESDRRVNCYVLSYLGQNGINHFRITAVCGDYYIGGQKFDSLSHLIGYYTSWSDLLKKERLVFPVQPPEPVSDYKRVVAILPYTKIPDTDELTFQKGDILLVRNDLSDGWFWCESHRTHESGLVFKDLVEELEDSVDPNEMFSWFHSNISKEEASEKLSKMGPGSFLVKKSERSPGNYSLIFHIQHTVQRFRIEKVGSKYVMGGRTFNNLEDVIKRYQHEQIVEGYFLGDPVLKAPHQISLRSRPIIRKISANMNGNCAVASEVSNNSQDVYATLRESREMAKKKQSGGMSGYLYKKSQRHKKWKKLHFRVDTKEMHLCFYDNEKQTKPKGLADLSNSYLYLVHDSLLDRAFCFQIMERALPCISTQHYLCAENAETFLKWIEALKPLCTPQQPKVKRAMSITEVRTLYVSLVEAKRLPVKIAPHPYCIMSLNSVKVSRTQVKCPPDPVWEEDFVLEDIPSDVTSFNITVFNKGKRSKDNEVADMTVQLNELKNGLEHEEWYPLNGLNPPVREDWGLLRVKLRYVYEVIMPRREYSSLKDLIMNDDLEVISALENICHKERATLAHALLRVFLFERKEGSLLKAMVEKEINRETETGTLFRQNCLTTTIMDQFMRGACQQFLESALSDSLRRVMETKQSCELNPSKFDSLDAACSNAEMLLSLLDDIVDCIFHSVESCPPMLRFICGCLQRAVAAKWPNDNLVRTRVVGGFIFLRLLCPAILNPRQFNLIDAEMPSEQAGRTLMLIAKCLQNLANLVEFGTKISTSSAPVAVDRGPAVECAPPYMKREPWMEVVNPFILKNKAKMIKFMDDIAMVCDLPEPDGSVRGEPDRDLATIHSMCETHREEIIERSQKEPMLRRLTAVTAYLSQQKQRFAESLI